MLNTFMRNYYAFFLFFIILGSAFIGFTRLNSKPQAIYEFSYACEKDKTPFDLLLTHARAVKFQDGSYGKMVTAINNSNQGGGKYWQYSVNSKEATVGASIYHCQGEENIKWELK